MNKNLKFIHLLYVPTMNCNMRCKYCYLHENTTDLKPDSRYLKTLQYAVDKFRQSDVIPFNISLHGGEVTTLAETDFRDIIEYIADYYRQNKNLIEENGFKVGRPHIKTNLLNLEKHIDTIREFNVSISGSLDLPFSLHEEYRVTKGGGKTLDKILENVKLLEDIPNRKKVSATVFREHYERIKELIDDMRYLDENTCLDMNDFNFMIGFADGADAGLHPLSEPEQVDFYDKMKAAFTGTSMDYGLKHTWFAEFTPVYCTNSDNCGDKFFLLERNGDIYSCVRGQHHKEFYYGNIYKDSVEEILKTARVKIFENHNSVEFDKKCVSCKYLYLCKTGCPYVKKANKTGRSYTCLLQQEIYQDNPMIYQEDQHPELSLYDYLIKMHPVIAGEYLPQMENQENAEEINDSTNLLTIIKNDDKLTNIYASDVFILKVDEREYFLESQIIKKHRDIIYLTDKTVLKLYIKKGVLEDCDYPVNNSLYMMLLSGNLVTYGDEQRTKQEHIMTHQTYTDTVKKETSDKDGYYEVDITGILRLYYDKLSSEKPNNLFFTTDMLRGYHYTKQKNNAYYHIQAINLPFQNVEFFYINCKEVL